VETTKTKYDVIISEPSNPWLTGVANLFTREYFAAARRALTPDGRLVAWFPLYAMDPPALRSVLAALRAEFPNTYALMLSRDVPDLMLLATMQPLTPADLPRWESLDPAVQADLYRVGTHSTAELWSLLRLMPDDVAAVVGDGVRENSDDNLFVELRTPWLLYADHFAGPGPGPSAQTWKAIDDAPSSTAALIEPALAGPGGPRPGELALAALSVRGDASAATRWIERAGDSGEGIAARAQLARAQNRLEEPAYAAALDRALELEPRSYDARMLRSRHRLAQGDPQGALADVDAALALRPGDPALLGVRAGVLYGLNRFAEARTDLAAVEKSEYWGWAADLWYLAGMSALQDGDLQDGIARLEKYVEYEPGFVAAWSVLEQAYTAKGREADAARARRNQAMILYIIALSSEKAGDKAGAVQRLRRALVIQPDHTLAREALSRLGG
jgi:spermidine synthase